MDPKSRFSLNDHLEMLSRHGDPLEVLERTVDFEYFRVWLVEGLGYGDGSKGGRPPFDPVAMFKILIVQAQHNLSDARMQYMIRDRLSWMRFLGCALGNRTPGENTIRHFCHRMTETGTLKRVMKAFDWQLHKKGYIPMSGQIIDASLVPAPKQRNADDERQAIKDGKSAKETWPDDPAKAAQKDTDARWTLKIGGTDARWTLKIGGKVRYKNGKPLPMIALPVFGYKSHISIDRRYGFIRAGEVTSAAHAYGRMLRHVIAENSSSEVWPDTAYRSRTNEVWLADRFLTSRIHGENPKASRCPRPPLAPMLQNLRSVPGSSMCSRIRKTGSGCSSAPLVSSGPKLTRANLAYNFDRLIFHERRSATA